MTSHKKFNFAKILILNFRAFRLKTIVETWKVRRIHVLITITKKTIIDWCASCLKCLYGIRKTQIPLCRYRKSKDGFFQQLAQLVRVVGAVRTAEDRTVILKSTGSREPRKHGEHHLEHQRAGLRKESSPEHLFWSWPAWIVVVTPDWT